MRIKTLALSRHEKNHIDTIYYSSFSARFGKFLVASIDNNICNILLFKKLSETLAELQTSWPKVTLIKREMPIHKLIKKVFSGEKINSTINLILRGTDFQIKIWQALLTIPKGKTSTYAKIASQIGKPKAVRAVGTAIGDNPLCYLIPCHRVLSSDGSIGGYRWGIAVKKKILQHEKLKQ